MAEENKMRLGIIDEVWQIVRLHHGHADPVTIDTISEVTGYTSRAIKRSVKILVEAFNHPIGASRNKPHGYYMIETPEDLDMALRPLRAEIISIARRVRILAGNKGLQELFGAVQQELDFTPSALTTETQRHGEEVRNVLVCGGHINRSNVCNGWAAGIGDLVDRDRNVIFHGSLCMVHGTEPSKIWKTISGAMGVCDVKPINFELFKNAPPPAAPEPDCITRTNPGQCGAPRSRVRRCNAEATGTAELVTMDSNHQIYYTGPVCKKHGESTTTLFDLTQNPEIVTPVGYKPYPAKAEN